MSYYDLLRDEFARLSGYTPREGSELSLRFHAYAAQLDALSHHADWALAQAFPQSAAGDALDRHAAVRGVVRNPGAFAAGTLCFGRETAASAALIIPQGTVCLTEGLVRFETTEEGAITPGETTAYIPAKACEAGVNGNARSGEICLMAAPPVGVVWCVNAGDFSGGLDSEGDDALRARLLATYQTLPNGTNAAFYRQEALGVAGVAAVTVTPRVNGRGTVGVTVAAPEGIPSAELVEAVRARLQAVREIAVDVTVRAPTPQTVALTAKILPGTEGFSAVKTRVEAALRGFFSGGLLGKGLTLAALGKVIFDTAGVQNYKITAPAADLPALPDGLPVLGSLSLTEMGG